MNAQRLFALVAVMLGLALLVLASALLVAAASVGAQLLTGWVLISFQLALAGTLGASAVACITAMARKTMDELSALASRHAVQMAALKKRTPTLFAVTALAAQAVTVLADKAFEGNTPATLAVTLVLILWFYVANELLTRLAPRWRPLGYAFWVLGVLALPFFIWVHRGYQASLVMADFIALSPAQQLVFGSCCVLFMVVPFLVDF